MSNACHRHRRHQKPSWLARILVFASLGVALSARAATATALPLGATADLTSLNPAARSAVLTRLVESGVTRLRYTLDWSRVEPEPDRFTWGADDAVIAAAQAHGLEVMLVLGPTAVWAVDPAIQLTPEQSRCSVPRKPALWERYVRQAAIHYRGKVRYWQIREQPNARQFRGAVQEYLALLREAARVLREVDPQNRIIAPEPVGFDPGGLDRRLQPPIDKTWDVWGAYLPARATLSSGTLALSIMATEALTPPRPRRPIWVVGAEAPLSVDRWRQYYLLASAFGVQRFYAPEAVINPQWAPAVSRLEYRGYLRLGPTVWALVFAAGGDEMIVAWSDAETRLPASALAPVRRPEQVRASAAWGDRPGTACEASDSEPMLVLGPRPVFLRGFDARAASAGPPPREAVLRGRDRPSLCDASSVSADYRRTQAPERGLYNRALRSLPGGAVREETFDGRLALGTELYPTTRPLVQNDPWMYFDVDDSWLYFARGRVPVTVTIEAHACSTGPQRIGFNIHYDSIDGYRATKWQWVEAGEGWHTYRVVLPDASFTNRNGYDFRINAQGSRQDLWVSSVTVSR
jgi:hypothetical protein